MTWWLWLIVACAAWCAASLLVAVPIGRLLGKRTSRQDAERTSRQDAERTSRQVG